MTQKDCINDLYEEELDCMDGKQLSKLGRRMKLTKKVKKAAKLDKDN